MSGKEKEILVLADQTLEQFLVSTHLKLPLSYLLVGGACLLWGLNGAAFGYFVRVLLIGFEYFYAKRIFCLRVCKQEYYQENPKQVYDMQTYSHTLLSRFSGYAPTVRTASASLMRDGKSSIVST